eukprot:scaffold29681_cov54-Attheya_sp.AAC.3
MVAHPKYTPVGTWVKAVENNEAGKLAVGKPNFFPPLPYPSATAPRNLMTSLHFKSSTFSIDDDDDDDEEEAASCKEMDECRCSRIPVLVLVWNTFWNGRRFIIVVALPILPPLLISIVVVRLANDKVNASTGTQFTAIDHIINNIPNHVSTQEHLLLADDDAMIRLFALVDYDSSEERTRPVLITVANAIDARVSRSRSADVVMTTFFRKIFPICAQATW